MKNAVHNWVISIKKVNIVGEAYKKQTSSTFKAGQTLKKSGFATDSIGWNWKQDLRKPVLLGEKYKKQLGKIARCI